MNRVMFGGPRRFAKLSFADQAATLEALAAVGAARAMLSTLKPTALGQLLQPVLRDAPPHDDIQDPHTTAAVERVRSAMQRASRRVPGATCLVQALAGWWMLKMRAIRAQVRIGVDKSEQGFSAHAWLVVDNKVVLGGADAAARFVVLKA